MEMKETRTALWRRRQFFLGPRPSSLLPWTSHAVGRGLCLQAHPDLTLVQTDKRNGIELTLVGDIVDPGHPDAANIDILRRLQRHTTSAGEIHRLTSGLGGRWVLFVDDGKSTVAHHDPCGLRQLFYSIDELSGPFCASQAEAIAVEAGFSIDPKAHEGFSSSRYVQSDPEWWWPGDSCAYEKIKRLLPNHCLDLRTRTARRFWPAHALKSRDIEEAELRASDLLKGLVEAAEKRFPLSLPITAGFDSRVILAATRSVAKRIFFYTIRMPHHENGHPDLSIPRKLLRKLGLEHHILSATSKVGDTFWEEYRSNVNPAHKLAGAMAEALLQTYPQERVCLVGHAAEIARCFYYRTAANHPAKVTPETLANLTGMGDNAFAQDEFRRWLAGAEEAAHASGIRLLDLFYWEQRAGSWAAAGEAEWDIFQERFPPFVCRDLYEVLLSVDAVFREYPDYTLFTRIARRLWPEVLSEPINPKGESVAGRVRSFLRRIGKKTASSVTQLWGVRT
jgi:hypothetical protein